MVPLSSMDVRRHKHVSVGQIHEGYNREELVYYSYKNTEGKQK